MNAILRNLARLAVIGVLVWASLLALDWLRMETGPSGMAALALLLLIYMLILATPFMPGVEIGLALLVMRGADAAPLVWAATVMGLCLAWLVGRWLPTPWIISALRDLRLDTPADMVARISGTPSDLRLRYLCRHAPNWLARILRDWRYVALALMLNLPGNVVVGGGGGLAMLAGLSRIFAPAATFLTFLVGTAPIPLAVWIFGPRFLPWTG